MYIRLLKPRKAEQIVSHKAISVAVSGTLRQ